MDRPGGENIGPAFRLTDPAEVEAVRGALVGPARQLHPDEVGRIAYLVQGH